MADYISFPALGWEFPINRVAFYVGPLTVYWYGLLFALAFALGTFYAIRRCKAFGVNPDKMFDTVFAAFIGGIIGARIYYVIFSWELYRDNPIRIFYIWEGGIAMYGGIIGAFLVGYMMCRIRKIKLLPAFDVGAIGLLLAQAIGRWGNFLNMEAFGSNTTLPWGMTSFTISNYLALHKPALDALGVAVDPNLPVHPTFLYESLWNLLGFLLFAFVFTKVRRFDGQMFLGYLMWYGAGRFFIEGLRTDSLVLVGLRVSQGLALVTFLVAGIIMLAVYGKIREHGNDPEYLKPYGKTEAGMLDAEDSGGKEPEADEDDGKEAQDKTDEPAPAPKDDGDEAKKNDAAKTTPKPRAKGKSATKSKEEDSKEAENKTEES